jgi:uncharacterized membrane protein YuzA (DUF378 family)
MRHCILFPILAFVLVVVGGLNWGLVGLLNFNLVDALFGKGSKLSRLVYLLVGMSSVFLMVMAIKKHKACCRRDWHEEESMSRRE